MLFITKNNIQFESNDSSASGESNSGNDHPQVEDNDHSLKAEASSEVDKSAEALESAEGQAAELTAKLQETNDRMLRIAAEFEN